MKTLRKSGLITALLMVTILAIPAFAGPIVVVPVLRLSDGTTTVTVTDGGAGDINPLTGAVTYLGSVGSWFLNVSTGISKPILGSALDPQVDLNSVDASSPGGGTLTISFVDGDFVSSPSGNPIGMSIGGTLANGGTISFETFYYDSNATDFVGGNLISSLNFSTSPFSGSASGFINPASELFSLAEVVTITHRGFGITSFDAAVPEPGTLLLLGSGLIGFAFWGRSKYRK